MIKRHIKLSLSLICIFNFYTLYVFSQEGVNQEVKVVKPYEPVISDAFKISELPKISDTAKVEVDFEYEIVSQKYETGFQPKIINPARLVGEPLPKLYNAYLKAGFGSYLTPMGEFYVGSKRDEDWNWSANINYISSNGKVKNIDNNKVYSGYSNTKSMINASKFFVNNQKLTLKANYSNNQHYYYGYNPEVFQLNGTTPPLTKDEIEKQAANFFSATAGWQTNYLDSSRVNFDINSTWQTFSALNNVSENALKINADFNYFFEKEFVGVDAAINYYSSTGIPDTTMEAIVKFSPWVGAFGNKWQIVVGANTYFDQINEKYQLYPRLSMHYNVIDYFLIPYVELTGAYVENSYKSIFMENPYIKQDIAVIPTNKKIDFSLGIRGNISSKIAFNLKANYSDINNAYFYVNDTSNSLQNKFNVVYDDIVLYRFLGEVSYKSREDLMLSLKGNYYHYQLKNELQAWHKPNYEVSINARYKIRDKFIIDGSVFAVGSRYAKEYNVAGDIIEKELQGVVDLNIGVEYRLSKILSGFVQFNNLAATQFYKWNNYPTQRFNVMLGITYAL